MPLAPHQYDSLVLLDRRRQRLEHRIQRRVTLVAGEEIADLHRQVRVAAAELPRPVVGRLGRVEMAVVLVEQSQAAVGQGVFLDRQRRFEFRPGVFQSPPSNWATPRYAWCSHVAPCAAAAARSTATQPGETLKLVGRFFSDSAENRPVASSPPKAVRPRPVRRQTLVRG